MACIPSRELFAAELACAVDPDIVPAHETFAAARFTVTELDWVALAVDTLYMVRLEPDELASLTVEELYELVVVRLVARTTGS